MHILLQLCAVLPLLFGLLSLGIAALKLNNREIEKYLNDEQEGNARMQGDLEYVDSIDSEDISELTDDESGVPSETSYFKQLNNEHDFSASDSGGYSMAMTGDKGARILRDLRNRQTPGYELRQIHPRRGRLQQPIIPHYNGQLPENRYQRPAPRSPPIIPVRRPIFKPTPLVNRLVPQPWLQKPELLGQTLAQIPPISRPPVMLPSPAFELKPSLNSEESLSSHRSLSTLVQKVTSNQQKSYDVPQRVKGAQFAPFGETFSAVSQLTNKSYTLTLIKPLGKGAFGQVYLVLDDNGNEFAAKSYFGKEGETFGEAYSQIDAELKLIRGVAGSTEPTQAGEKFHLLLPVDLVKRVDYPDIYNAPDGGVFLNRLLLYPAMSTDLEKMGTHLAKPNEICSALDASQQLIVGTANFNRLGYVHYDIKPENVLVRNDGIVFVADLSGAKRVGSVSDSIVISAAYTAPEMARGLLHDDFPPADPKHDAWSVGVSLYEIWCNEKLIPLTGGRNRGMDYYLRVIARLTDRDIRFSPSCSARTPPEMRDLIMRLLQVDPRKRISSQQATRHPIALQVACGG